MLVVQRLTKGFYTTGERTKSVFSGSMVMVLSTIISTLTRVGLISILARIYTRDQFGVWVTITSVTAIMSTNDFGIGNALRNKLSELRVKNEKTADDEAREYFLSIFYFFLIIAVLASIALILFHQYIPYHKLVNTDNLALQSEVVDILIIVQVLFLLSIPFGIGTNMFFAYMESFWVGFFNIMIGVCTICVIGYLALAGKSITIAAITFFSITILISTAGSLYFLYRRKWNILHVNLRKMLPRVWSLLAQSFAFATLQIGSTFMYNAITIVVTANISLTDAAELNLVQKLYTFILAVYLSLYNPLWAGYSDAIHRKDWQWTKKTLIRTFFGTIFLFTAALTVFAYSGNFFLQVLAGNNYVSQSILFVLMGLWALFYSLYMLGFAFLSAAGKIKPITILTGCFALFFVSVATYFSDKWGIVGISIWSALSFLLLTIATYYHTYCIIRKGELSSLNN